MNWSIIIYIYLTGSVIKESDPEICQLRNDVYTACKVGNLENLNLLLPKLKEACDRILLPDEWKNSRGRLESTCSESTSEAFTTAPEDENPSDTGSAPGGNTRAADGVTAVEKMSAILNDSIGAQGTTLLHLAATRGHKEIVRFLLEAGCDPSIK